MPVLNLTDLSVKTARPREGERQTAYFDSAVRGLSLLVSAGGARSWYLTYTAPGGRKRVRAKLGTYPELSLGKARAKARELRGSVGEGVDPVAEKQAKAAAMTVADLIDSYADKHAARLRSGAETVQRLRSNLAPIAAVPLAKLHRRDITRCIDEVMGRGKPAAAALLFRNVRGLVRWALARGDVDSDVTAGMRPPAKIEPRERVLTEGEVATVWGHLDGAKMDAGTRRVLRLCLATAQRVGEVAEAKLEEFDLPAGVWTIPADRAKNGRAHSVPLSPFARGIINEQIAHLDAERERRAQRYRTPIADRPAWLFPGPGDDAPIGARAVAKAVLRQTDDGRICGVAPWTPHDLRRTAATLMEGLGVSTFTVAHVLNHISVTRGSITSRVYARHDYGPEKREALDAWGARLAKIVGEGG